MNSIAEIHLTSLFMHLYHGYYTLDNNPQTIKVRFDMAYALACGIIAIGNPAWSYRRVPYSDLY